MDNITDQSTPHNLISFKTVIRAKAFEASVHFYTQILHLEIVETYDDGAGSKGTIVSLSAKESNAFLEISKIEEGNDYYQPAFDDDFDNDKISIQIGTTDILYWQEHLNGKWDCEGPILRPWGASYLYLRDPDGMPVIIYQDDVSV